MVNRKKEPKFIRSLTHSEKDTHLEINLSSRACGCGIMNVGKVTLMNGTGIHPNRSTCPENASCRRHSGSCNECDVCSCSWCVCGVVVVVECPLYKGVIRTLDRWICAMDSKIHKHFSKKEEMDMIKSMHNRTSCKDRNAGIMYRSSNRVGK